MIPTATRIEYANGFMSLGLFDQAADELEEIEFSERLFPEVLAARVELHTLAKQWPIVAGVSKELARQRPEDERGWISWGLALREMSQIAEAREALLNAESWHGKTSSNLHYNLACYYSLLGDQENAKDRLNRAFHLDKSWREIALGDKDLESLWHSIGLMA
jgi:tetratricopeptide (TPR) repeat protein